MNLPHVSSRDIEKGLVNVYTSGFALNKPVGIRVDGGPGIAYIILLYVLSISNSDAIAIMFPNITHLLLDAIRYLWLRML